MNHLKRVLITGGSGGIGYELARQFARHKYNLFLVSHEEKHLKEAKENLEKEFGISVDTLTIDLTMPGACQQVYEATRARKMQIDILVNNAGFGLSGIFHELPIDRQLNMIQLNISALVELTYLFLPDMLKYNSGKILNIASVAGFRPGGSMAIYHATKSFVISFSTSLAAELEGEDIVVTTLCPGQTATSFEKVATEGKMNIFNHETIATPEDVARFGYKSLMKGKYLVIHGWHNRWKTFLTRFRSYRSMAREKLAKYKNKN